MVSMQAASSLSPPHAEPPPMAQVPRPILHTGLSSFPILIVFILVRLSICTEEHDLLGCSLFYCCTYEALQLQEAYIGMLTDGIHGCLAKLCMDVNLRNSKADSGSDILITDTGCTMKYQRNTDCTSKFSFGSEV